MNLPNKLTLSRFVLTVGFMAVMFSRIALHETVALCYFSRPAGISDFLDGQIARRRKLITNFGILMDPLADKIMVCSAFIAFVDLKWIPSWMVVIIVARELAITGLRLLAASKNLCSPPKPLGNTRRFPKSWRSSRSLWNTVIRTGAALETLFFGLHICFDGPGLNGLPSFQVDCRGLTFVSGWIYFWKNRHLYLEDL